MTSLRVVLFAMLLQQSMPDSYHESTFVKEPICDVQKRIADGCLREVSQRGLIRCLSECDRESVCQGTSLERKSGKCFLHEECGFGDTCVTIDTEHDYYAKNCVHGHWDKGTDSCKCEYGCFGVRCDKAHKDCYELYPAGFSEGLHTVFIDPLQNGVLYKVNCYITANGFVAVFVAKNYGGISFNRTWSEYVHGFQSEDSSNLWIGLKTWHVLSTYANCDRMFAAVGFKDGANSYFWYKEFKVGSNVDNFTFTFRNSYFNYGKRLHYTLEDCMDPIQNTPFSTWDRLNGLNMNQNCPSLFGVGWWFPDDCDYPCNYLAWGLEDWNSETKHQRFAPWGVNMPEAIPLTEGFAAYISCDH